MKSIKFLSLSFTLILVSNTAFSQLNISEVTDFTLIDAISNKTVSLYDYKSSNAVVVIFTSNTCPYAKLYEDRILDLHKTYSTKGVQFLLINSNNSPLTDSDNIPRMKIKANTKKYPFPYLADKDALAKNIFKAEKTPEAFVIANRNGSMTTFYQGAIDDSPQSAEQVESNYIVLALDNILEGKPSPVQYKRPVGCRIKIQ